jgi:hypothetical protein
MGLLRWSSALAFTQWGHASTHGPPRPFPPSHRTERTCGRPDHHGALTSHSEPTLAGLESDSSRLRAPTSPTPSERTLRAPVTCHCTGQTRGLCGPSCNRGRMREGRRTYRVSCVGGSACGRHFSTLRIDVGVGGMLKQGYHGGSARVYCMQMERE